MNKLLSHVNPALAIVRSRKFALIFASFVGLLSPIALFASNSAAQENEFLSMTTLDSNMKVDEYFPNNSTINVGDRMGWYIKVYNGMNSPEYLAVKIKILNSTQTTPVDALNRPSPSPELFEYHHLVSNNATMTIPFEWSILDIESHDGQLTIRNVMINGEEIDNLDISSMDGQDFRILFELWRYNHDSEDLEFEWSSSAQNKRSVWNQIWFSVKS